MPLEYSSSPVVLFSLLTSAWHAPGLEVISYFNRGIFHKHQRPTCSSQISVKEHCLISFPWVLQVTPQWCISCTGWPSINRLVSAFGEELRDSVLCNNLLDGNMRLTSHSFLELYRWSSFSFSQTWWSQNVHLEVLHIFRKSVLPREMSWFS